MATLNLQRVYQAKTAGWNAPGLCCPAKEKEPAVQRGLCSLSAGTPLRFLGPLNTLSQLWAFCASIVEVHIVNVSCDDATP